MKNLFQLTVISLSITSILACTNAPESDNAKTGEAKEVTENIQGEIYKVDAASSNVEWIGTKVSGYHTGTVKIKNGELMVGNGNLTGGKIVLDMTTITASGPGKTEDEMNKKLTGHLQSPDFFDVATYPEATFEITGVKPFSGVVNDSIDPRQESISKYKVANPTHTISGNLTIKGITKNIEFPAGITSSENGMDAIAKFNIDRTQWNIVYPGKPDDLIRNEIHFGISVKAIK